MKMNLRPTNLFFNVWRPYLVPGLLAGAIPTRNRFLARVRP